MNIETKFCPKCEKTLKIDNFYKGRDGELFDLCKKCSTMHVNVFKEDTFLWLLEKIDVPYVPEEWNAVRDKAFARDPKKANATGIFGRYLSKMKLKQWKDYRWEDSEKLQQRNEEAREAKRLEQEILEEQLKQQLEEGVITEAQYRTYIPPKDYNDVAPIQNAFEEAASHFSFPTESISSSELPSPEDELTKDDKIFLAMKWGRLYQPGEWIELEQKYKEMNSSFDFQDADSIETLKFLCKTSLKMHAALDCGDVDGYQKLTKVYNDLRKSLKVTAAQNKENKTDRIDCVGNIALLCEEYGGKIPRYDITVDPDKLDKIIWDLKGYNKSLVENDASLSKEIENHLKKIENAKKEEIAEAEALKSGKHYIELSDADMQEEAERIYAEREEDLI